MPRISVIMSVYNSEKYLKEAINSVLKQSFVDFEFIIINDGSVDQSRAIIESYVDSRIKLINNQNKGLTKSLNEAIGHCHGAYIARMDADDVSFPERFEKQINFLDSNPDIVMCGTWAEFIDEGGKYVKDYERPATNQKIKREILFHNPFIHPSVMIRRKIFDQVGLYDEKFRYAQDYELWTRIVPRFKTANIPERLLSYRLVGEGITKSKNLKVRMLGLKIRWVCFWRLSFA